MVPKKWIRPVFVYLPAAGNLTEGTSVTVTVAPAAGKQVATFTVGGVDKKAELAGNQYTFNMPAAATEVAVTYENIPGHVINITANNTVLVGRHAFNLEQATQDDLAAGKKYTLNNYLTAVDTGFTNSLLEPTMFTITQVPNGMTWLPIQTSITQ